MSGADSEPIHVLHVDDEPDLTELTATFLEREREDFEVSTATSAADGLAHVNEAETPVDCIVSDYNMPGMNGLEFLEAVREDYPELPFVLFTGRGSEEIASEAISAGVTEYLNKEAGTDQYTVLANRIDNAVSQYRAERDLRTSTERLRKLYGGITDAIFVLDTDWRFTHLNDRAEEILERTEAELIGENVWDQFPEAVDTPFQDEYEKAMNQRVPVEFETFYPPLDVWVNVRAVPTENGLTAHFRDISEKKERERQIQRQNERLRTIVENAPVVLFAFDEEGVVTLAEGQGLTGLGLEPEDVVGESVFDLYAGTPIVEDVQRAIDGEAVHSTAEVGDRTFEGWYQPVESDSDTESRTIGVAIDVTDRAERERRFDAVFNNTFQFTGLLQPDGTLIEINDTALQFTDNDRTAVVGQPFWELTPWEASEGASGRVKDAVERAANDEFVRFEEELGRGDDVITIDVSIKPVTNEHGEVAYLVSEGRNITERAERERELREEQAFVESVFDAIPDVLYAFDEERTMLRWNEQLSALIGYSDTEIAEMTPLDFVADEDMEALQETSARVFGEGTVDTDRVNLVTKAGEHVPMELTAAPIRGEDGTIVGLTGTGRDITERKERERELERNTDLLERTQRLATVGGWELDLREDELRWTDEVRRIHGVALDYEPELENALDFYHPEDLSIIEEAVERAIEDGESFDVECRLVTAGGDLRWVRAQGKPRREAGETVVLRGAFQDITERKAHEQELETYTTMVNSVPDFVYRLDTDGQYIAVNDTANAVTGYSPEEMRGEHVSIIMDDEDIATGERVIRDLLKDDDREQATFEMDIVSANGERVPFECHISIVRSQTGRFRGTVGIVRDITERKRNEERLEALHEGTRAMMNAGTPEEVGELAVETARDALGLPLTGFWSYDPDHVCLRPTAVTDEAHTLFDDFPIYTSGNSLSWEVFTTGEPVVYDDVGSQPDAYDPDTPIESEIVVPLGDYGVLNCGSTEPGTFDDVDLSAARILAANTEAALERAEREALLRDRETQLQGERDRLAALFENIPDPVFRHSRENGAIVPQAVNPAFERVFGYDEEWVVGRSIAETIVPSDRIEEHEALAAASGAGESLDAEVERLTATGQRTFLLRNAPIDTPTGDRSVEYAIYTDITERREAEEYRRRLYEIVSDAELTAEERVNGLLELGSERLGMETGFLTRIEDDTQQVVEAYGPHEKIQPGSECPLSQAYCRRTIETDTPLTLRHAAEAGWEDDPAYEEFGLEAYVGAKLTIDGDLYGTVCFADRSPREQEFSLVELAFVDLVTRGIASELERRRYERELERQNNRLEEFASVVSHDLRNPLGIAQGYLELARESGEMKDFAKIARAHDRIEAIIEDVLTLARQGKSIGDTDTVALTSIAEQAWNNVETGNAELLNGDDLGTIDADEGRLEQLFENLFRNAIEHGGEDVTVRLDHSSVGFSVEDDGPGIPEDGREQVFNHGHTTSESGTGFGLSIVEQIVDAHGWEITVSEGTDGGARFEIHV